MTLLDTPAEAAKAKFDGAYRGRRLSLREFYSIRPDLRPANDNEPQPAATVRKAASR